MDKKNDTNLTILVGEDVPIVVFCVEEIAEGDEVAIGENVHVTRPDNFNQLRSFSLDCCRAFPKQLE